MHSFLQRFAGEPELKGSSRKANLLRFDATSIVQAIVFHLLDEETFQDVNPESIKIATRVLDSWLDCVTISQGEWAEMSNIQRLHWLQHRGKISVRAIKFGVAWLTCVQRIA